jgi:hypothetical protein
VKVKQPTTKREEVAAMLPDWGGSGITPPLGSEMATIEFGGDAFVLIALASGEHSKAWLQRSGNWDKSGAFEAIAPSFLKAIGLSSAPSVAVARIGLRRAGSGRQKLTNLDKPLAANLG